MHGRGAVVEFDAEQGGDDADFADVLVRVGEGEVEEALALGPAEVVLEQAGGTGVGEALGEEDTAEERLVEGRVEVEAVELGDDGARAGFDRLRIALQGRQVDGCVEFVHLGEGHTAAIVAPGNVYALGPIAGYVQGTGVASRTGIQDLGQAGDEAVDGGIFDPGKMPEVPGDGVELWVGAYTHEVGRHVGPQAPEPEVVERIVAL